MFLLPLLIAAFVGEVKPLFKSLGESDDYVRSRLVKFTGRPTGQVKNETNRYIKENSTNYGLRSNKFKGLFDGSSQIQHEEACSSVCDDLPALDQEPVCFMTSRYKKGYHFYVNLCQARRAICLENSLLHMVHVSRCTKSKHYYLPIN